MTYSMGEVRRSVLYQNKFFRVIRFELEDNDRQQPLDIDRVLLDSLEKNSMGEEVWVHYDVKDQNLLRLIREILLKKEDPER